MVNIIVIAHAEIANSFAYCAEHILNKRITNLHILSVKKTEDVDTILDNAYKLINKIGSNRQILILADLFGATPSNIAGKLVKKGKIELITGLNLAMLIRAVSYTEYDLDYCVKKVIDGAHANIIHVSDSLGEDNLND